MAAILEQIEKIPVKQRALLLGMVVVLLGVGFYYAVYSPKSTQIAYRRDQLSKLTVEVQQLKAIEAKILEVKKDIADKEAKLEAARQQLPREKEIPNILEAISGFGKESGVEFISFRPATESIKGFYAEVPLTLALRGPFHNIGSFLDKISHYPRIINVVNFNLGGPEEKEGYLMLTSTCLANTYRYVEQK